MFHKKRRYRRSSRSSFSSFFRWLGDHMQIGAETRRGIFIIVLFLLGILSSLAIFNLSGQFGQGMVWLLGLALGWFKWLFPVIALTFCYFLVKDNLYHVRFINYLGAVLLILGLTAMWHLHFDASEAVEAAKAGLGGGYIGLAISMPLLKFLGFWGGMVVGLALFGIGLLLFLEMSLYGLFWPITITKLLFLKIYQIYTAIKEKASQVEDDSEGEEDEDYEEETAEGEESEEDEPEDGVVGEVSPHFQKIAIGDGQPQEVGAKATVEDEMDKAQIKKFGKKIELPIDLLTSRSTKPTSGDIKANQEIIKSTLANFGIEVEMGEVNIGPTVTQYTFRPAEGVKLSKIVVLNSNLSLALAAHSVRIEAPIPGRSLVGVEVPNQLAAKVTMQELLTSKEFKARTDNLSLSLGKDVSGKSFFAPLTKMPHLLIAGATGSGKSVCINSIIVSLLYENSPDDLKFILVDPKRVELPIYNGIPYLLTPVITDTKKTINALKWTVGEMDRRLDRLSRKGKRNIEDFNRNNTTDRMPYIVFVIDELADLMTSARNDIEAGIVRLAQMARAVGIHLILATQRPSVEVITGLIKANIPARISFSVLSLIDSRTILDSSGAEKLVGRGDMLYIGPAVAKPKRLQGVYLTDREIKDVVDYIKKQGSANYVEEITEKQNGNTLSDSGSGFSDDNSDEPLMGEAKDLIRQHGKASATLFQRYLRIGYSRAARIMDLLEQQGVVGKGDGAKAREVYLDKLGGVKDVVEFAAKEYDLDGELVPQSKTVFKDSTEDKNPLNDDTSDEEENSDEVDDESENTDNEDNDILKPSPGRAQPVEDDIKDGVVDFGDDKEDEEESEDIKDEAKDETSDKSEEDDSETDEESEEDESEADEVEEEAEDEEEIEDNDETEEDEEDDVEEEIEKPVSSGKSKKVFGDEEWS